MEGKLRDSIQKGKSGLQGGKMEGKLRDRTHQKGKSGLKGGKMEPPLWREN